MPRIARLIVPGLPHHVIQRGNRRQKVFFSDEDKKAYIAVLKAQCQRFGVSIWSYCLMDNHYHLYIESVQGNLSSVMHKINTSYVKYFNIKYDRIGPLFERRFNSKIVQSNNYSLTVMAYIHNNPVKDGLVKEIDQYLWSSYPIYIGKFKPRTFFETTMILDYFQMNKIAFKSEFKSSKLFPIWLSALNVMAKS